MVVYIADLLQPAIGPRYIAAVEERVYLEPTPQQIVPDVWIRRRQRDDRLEPSMVVREV